MTKGVHGGKQEKKAGHHESRSKSEPIQKKNEPESQIQDAASTTEQSQTEVEAQPSLHVEQKSRREQFLYWANKWNNVLLIAVPTVFNALVLAAILLQAYIYEKQWNSMQASIEETRRNRELEYRAYVVVKTAALVPQANNPTIGDITVTTFNSGRTPGIGSIKAIMRLQRDRLQRMLP